MGRAVRKSSRRGAPAGSGSARSWAGQAADRASQREQKKDAILRTAARRFLERGFHATSLDDIAALLNITKPTLYYYVKSKDDILLQVLDVAMEQIQNAVTEAERVGVDGREQLRVFVRRYVEIMAGDFGKCLVLGTVANIGDSNDRATPTLRRIDAALSGLMARGVEDGSLAALHPRIGVFALFGAMHWMARWHRADGSMSPEQIAKAMLELFESGLAPRGPAPRGSGRSGAARKRASSPRGGSSR